MERYLCAFALQLVKVAPFREDFLTTDGTDGTDGKEKKKFGKQELFIREIREIRGSISSVAACRAMPSRLCVNSALAIRGEILRKGAALTDCAAAKGLGGGLPAANRSRSKSGSRLPQPLCTALITEAVLEINGSVSRPKRKKRCNSFRVVISPPSHPG
jgi:hypothetical protein